MRFKNIFLDFDGTVAQSGPGILGALTSMFSTLSIEMPREEEMVKFIGPPVKYTLEKYYGITGEANDRAYAIFKDYYDKKGMYQMALYEGMEELLESLNERGRMVHLATGKRGYQAEAAADYLKVRHHFRHVFGAVPEKGYLVKRDVLKNGIALMGRFPEKPVMVGDRAIDIEGGRENGFATIGVLYGYGAKEEIRDAKPDYIAADVAELKKLLLEDQ